MFCSLNLKAEVLRFLSVFNVAIKIWKTGNNVSRSLYLQMDNVRNVLECQSIWQTKIIMFRKGGFLAEREKWKYVNDFIEVVNSYKYLGFILP
jgi:hypothetical protein